MDSSEGTAIPSNIAHECWQGDIPKIFHWPSFGSEAEGTFGNAPEGCAATMVYTYQWLLIGSLCNNEPVILVWSLGPRSSNRLRS